MFDELQQVVTAEQNRQKSVPVHFTPSEEYWNASDAFVKSKSRLPAMDEVLEKMANGETLPFNYKVNVIQGLQALNDIVNYQNSMQK